ncbi:unnamed protein product [Thlaspi arvense]|uniref:Secreted protein n=1 Tax=Thlaspi arvense TaxID=13288 RepID=A0AAU9T4V8_THLAR|nr:unnamed protein product [Thlaspi arvense]
MLLTLEPLLGPIGGGLGLVAVAAAGAVAGTPSDEDVSGGASSDALTTSLEPALLIGKKDTEFRDDEAPAEAVTLAVKTNTEDADAIAIFAFFFFFFFSLLIVLPTLKNGSCLSFVGCNIVRTAKKRGSV